MGCDLTVVNTAGPTKQQAVALHAQSNFAAFRMVNISAYQDTLYTHSFHQFYRDCHIYGTIDFIFDNTAVIFRNCQIFPRKPMPKQQNMITTHGRPMPQQQNMITAHGRFEPTQDTGFKLLLTARYGIQAALDREPRNFSTYLGRPWRPHTSKGQFLDLFGKDMEISC
ncbi:hypothetical protein AMTR_s00120p00079770 [Amborella trichopoda]|uniref:Pectinesterase catalytic domain-containing protein n=1 Tax=Amborella trichopoda TaxID=13333 RepID=W1NR89_AMBTC|nr:hypothetical protein AMTR_s00120p00079770 [Amborella trichopoda]